MHPLFLQYISYSKLSHGGVLYCYFSTFLWIHYEKGPR